MHLNMLSLNRNSNFRGDEMEKTNNKATNFQDKLNSTEKIVFSISSFYEGDVEREITFKDNKTILKKTSSKLGKEEENLMKNMGLTKDEFIKKLSLLKIENWDDEYFAPALDGEDCELKIYFLGDKKCLSKTGSNAYPSNFNELCNLLEVE